MPIANQPNPRLYILHANPLFYTFFLKEGPASEYLDSAAKTAPTRMDTPQKMISPENSPPWSPTIAPAIGLPTSAPKAAIPYKDPLRVPILRTSEKEATMAGTIESVQPEVKPYSTAYTITDVVVRAVSHTVRVKIPPSTVRGIITLKTPMRSPRYAGSSRPNVLMRFVRYERVREQD
jgi:hypothetical protein